MDTPKTHNIATSDTNADTRPLHELRAEVERAILNRMKSALDEHASIVSKLDELPPLVEALRAITDVRNGV